MVSILNPTDLLTETEFYKWLTVEMNNGAHHVHFIKAVSKYTNYDPYPFKGRDDGQAHKFVFDVFFKDNLKTLL